MNEDLNFSNSIQNQSAAAENTFEDSYEGEYQCMNKVLDLAKNKMIEIGKKMNLDEVDDGNDRYGSGGKKEDNLILPKSEEKSQKKIILDISKEKNFCLDLNKEKCEEKLNLNLKEYVSDSKNNLTKVINKKRKKIGDHSLELEVNEGIEPEEDEKQVQINKSLVLEKDWQKIILGKIMEKQEKKMKELEQKLNKQWNLKLEGLKNELQEEYSKVLDRSAFSEVDKFTSKEEFERKLANMKDVKEKEKMEESMKKIEVSRKLDLKEMIESLRKEINMKIGEVYDVMRANYVSKTEEKEDWPKSIIKNDESRTAELILDDLEKNGVETIKKSLEDFKAQISNLKENLKNLNFFNQIDLNSGALFDSNDKNLKMNMNKLYNFIKWRCSLKDMKECYMKSNQEYITLKILAKNKIY